MAMDPLHKALLKQTISVASATGVSTYGKPTYGAAASRSARVEPERRVVVGAGGTELATSHRVIVEDEVKLLDRVWLPGDSSNDETLARMPVAVDQLVTEFGATDHWEVLL